MDGKKLLQLFFGPDLNSGLLSLGRATQLIQSMGDWAGVYAGGGGFREKLEGQQRAKMEEK